MTEHDAEGSKFSVAGVFLVVLVCIPLLLFAPLILSFAEHYALGTDHVEEFCRTIGIHGFLSKVYEPVFHLFDRLF